MINLNENNSRGHKWKLDEYGKIDDFAMSYENHNGPECTECGYYFCEHCTPHGPTEDCDGWKPSFPPLDKEIAELLHGLLATPESNWYLEHETRGNLWDQPIHARILALSKEFIEVVEETFPELDTLEFRRKAINAVLEEIRG